MKIKKCRLCHSSEIKKVIDLDFHPLADTFLEKEDQLGAETFYPLQLGLCESCGHVFTLFAIPPEDRYQKHDYSYDSSNSIISVEHFQNFCKTVLTELSVQKESLIVDIGGNVGTLLSQFKENGFKKVLNIEPSKNISKIAVNNGIPTINGFFNNESSNYISENFDRKVDILLSSNVVNHADDIPDLLQSAKNILSEEGVFVFEVPYLMDLIQKTSFDTIYHEHVHYYGVKPLVAILKKYGFSIFKIQKIDYMCGSIRVFTSLKKPQSSFVSQMVEIENEFGLYDIKTYQKFSLRVKRMKISINSYLWEVRKKGGRIVGIGAATKGNTLLNYCKLDSDIISSISYTSKLKIGKYTPGSHIQIISDDEIDDSFTHAIILPWNIASLLKIKLKHLNLIFFAPQVDESL